MKKISFVALLSLSASLLCLTQAAAMSFSYQTLYVLGQRYLTTMTSPEQGSHQVPRFKVTDFCQKYICRELDHRSGQAPGTYVYEWLEDGLKSSDRTKYVSTLILASKNGVMRNATAYLYLKSTVSLNKSEIVAFRVLSQSLTGQELILKDLERCADQVSKTLRSYKIAKCNLMIGALKTYEGAKAPYYLQLIGEKDVLTNKYIYSVNAWY